MNIHITDQLTEYKIQGLFKTKKDYYSALTKGYNERDEKLQILNIKCHPMKSSSGLYASIWLRLDLVEVKGEIEQAEKGHE